MYVCVRACVYAYTKISSNERNFISGAIRVESQKKLLALDPAKW